MKLTSPLLLLVTLSLQLLTRILGDRYSSGPLLFSFHFLTLTTLLLSVTLLYLSTTRTCGLLLPATTYPRYTPPERPRPSRICASLGTRFLGIVAHELHLLQPPRFGPRSPASDFPVHTWGTGSPLVTTTTLLQHHHHDSVAHSVQQRSGPSVRTVDPRIRASVDPPLTPQ